MNLILEFIPTSELLRELLGRCDHGAIVLLRLGDTGPNRQSIQRLWKGNRHTAAGLCQDLQQAILLQYKAEEVETPGDLPDGA